MVPVARHLFSSGCCGTAALRHSLREPGLKGPGTSWREHSRTEPVQKGPGTSWRELQMEHIKRTLSSGCCCMAAQLHGQMEPALKEPGTLWREHGLMELQMECALRTLSSGRCGLVARWCALRMPALMGLGALWREQPTLMEPGPWEAPLHGQSFRPLAATQETAPGGLRPWTRLTSHQSSW